MARTEAVSHTVVNAHCFLLRPRKTAWLAGAALGKDSRIAMAKEVIGSQAGNMM